jgi:hypothetical protein
MLRQISRLEDCRGLHVIGAGAGDFLVVELAKQLGFKFKSVANLIVVDSNLKDHDETQSMAAVCFPAYAVASLGVEAQQC